MWSLFGSCILDGELFTLPTIIIWLELYLISFKCEVYSVVVY